MREHRSQGRTKTRVRSIVIAAVVMAASAAAVFAGMSFLDGQGPQKQQELQTAQTQEKQDTPVQPDPELMYDRDHDEPVCEWSTRETYWPGEIIVFAEEGADLSATAKAVRSRLSSGGAEEPQIAGINGYDRSVLLRWSGEMSYEELKEQIPLIRETGGVSDAALNYAILSEGRDPEDDPDEEETGLARWDADSIRAEQMLRDAAEHAAEAGKKIRYTDIGVINSDPELDASVDRILRALYHQGEPVRPEKALAADSVFGLNVQLAELVMEKDCRVVCLNVQQPLVSFAAAQGEEYAQQFLRLQSAILYKSMRGLERYISEHGDGSSGCVICTAAGDQKSFEYERDESQPYGFTPLQNAEDYSEDAMELYSHWAGCHTKWNLVNRIRMDASRQKALPHLQMICTGSLGREEDGLEMSRFSHLGYPVEVLAPGEDLWESAGNDSGTILAAAHTAGIAANALVLDAQLTPKECRDAIARNLGPLEGLHFLLSGENTANSLQKPRASGWQKQDGAWIYCTDEDRPAKGYTLIGGVPYYFEKGGVPAAQGWIGKRYYCDGGGRLHLGWLNDNGTARYFYPKDTGEQPAGTLAKGVRVPGGIEIPESGRIEGELGETLALAIDALDQTGWDLQGAYRYASSTDYADYEARYGMRVHKAALHALKTRDGNCISWSAEFCIMAKLLGYDCRQIWGFLGKGTEQPHSWTEIRDGGELRIFDPRHEEGLDTSGYDVRYGQKGTYRYDEKRKTYLKL